LNWFPRPELVCQLLRSGPNGFLALPVASTIRSCMSAPAGVISLPAMESEEYDWGSGNPNSAGPIDILAVADPNVFVAIPDVRVRSVGNVSAWCGWRKRGCHCLGVGRWRRGLAGSCRVSRLRLGDINNSPLHATGHYCQGATGQDHRKSGVHLFLCLY
jgi:hypothetical protein